MLLSEKEVRLSKLISDRKSLFPSSGELNFTVPDAENCIKMVKSAFAEDATVIDEMDGLSISFENWRFNLRRSNTEPLVRLNLETRGDQFLLAEKTKELKNLIERMWMNCLYPNFWSKMHFFNFFDGQFFGTRYCNVLCQLILIK